MFNIKKLFVLAVVIAMVAALVVGCTSSNGAPDSGDKIKIGLVYDVGGRGDKSFNDSAYAGLMMAKDEFGDKIEVKDLEPTAGGEDREDLMRGLAEQGYDLIFGVGFLFAQHIGNVASDFPETNFGLVDGFIDGLDADSNIALLLFKEHEGSFLVGAAAALKSKTGVIGFVGGMESPLIQRFEMGYIAGAKYINPDIEVLSEYVGTTGDAFKNPTRGEEIALAQIDAGADVIYHASGASGTGVIKAATNRGVLAIGVDSDQSLTASDAEREHILTSMLKRVDISVYETIAAQVNGEFTGGSHVFGLAEDGVGYAVNDYNQDMISDISGQLEELKQKIINGEIDVPYDPDGLEAFIASLE